MSYKELEEAKTKRAAKEKALEGKGKQKRGRPRKTPAPEEEAEAEAGKGTRGRKKRKTLALEAEAEAEAVEAGSSVPKDKVTWISEVDGRLGVEPLTALGTPWRAPVARMY